MRLVQLAAFATALWLSGCLGHEESCAARPSDPLCQLPDAGGRDTGVDGGSGDSATDARRPCGGTCTGATPHCLVSGSTETCVGCTGNGDCTTGTARVCDTAGTHTCVGCVSETDCTGGTHCETTSRTCVACLTSAECSTAASARCDTTGHTCTTCTASSDCTHLAATPICGAAGACVQCNANADCDATHGCDLATNACVTFTAMGVSTCGSCVRDAQCHTGQLCVPTTYDDPSTAAADPVPTGNHCLWRRDATGAGAPNGSCLTIRPYARAATATSVDGTATTVCALAVSTCEAQTAFRMTDCMTLDAAGDARCGVTAVHDGVCRMQDATHNRCTVFCGSDDDCPTGFPCDSGASPRVCMF